MDNDYRDQLERLNEKVEQLRKENALLKEQVSSGNGGGNEFHWSESLLQNTFMFTCTGISIGDAKGKIHFVNKKLADMLGYTIDELIGMHFIQITHPADAQKNLEDYEKLVNGTIQSFQMKKRYLAKNGTTVYVEIFVSSIFDESGYFKRSLAFINDVTEQKQSEERHIEKEQQLKHKLFNILSPDYETEDEQLENIIDTDAIQALMDDFFAITNLPMSIIDNNGKILVGTGWQEICTKFHRVHPETKKNCIESDVFLTKDLKPGQHISYRCKNNMLDMAIPIYINNKRYGTFFTGQFFFEDDDIDREFFADQADKYGFDKNEYLAALDRVPRIKRDVIDYAIRFYTKFSELISSLSYSNLSLAVLLQKQRRTEKALTESENKLRKIADNVPGIVYQFKIDTDGNRFFPFMSKKVKEQYGFEAEAVMEDASFMVNAVHPDDREAFNKAVAMSAEKLEPYALTHRMVGKDGKISWLSAHSTPERQPDGSTVWTGLAVDVTSQMNAQQALAESEQRYKKLIQNLPDIVYIYSTKKGASFWSERVKDILKISPDALKDDPFMWHNSIHPDDLERVKKLLASMKPGDNFDIEYRVYDSEKEIHWMRDRGFNCRLVNGDMIIEGVATDTTNIRKADAALRKSEAKFRLLAENATDLISKHKPDGTYTYASPIVKSLLGYEPEELQDVDSYSLYHPDDVQAVRNSHDFILQKNKGYTVTYRIKRKDGKYIWLETTSKTVRNPDTNEVLEIIAISRDVTKRIAMENEMKKREQQFREMFLQHSAVMLLIDPNQKGAIKDANDSAAHFYGYTKEQLLTMKISDINILPNNTVLDRMDKAAVNKENIFEFKHRLANGAVRDVLVNSTPISISGKKILFSIIHDITEGKKAERALKDSLTDLQLAQKIADIGNWSLDPDVGVPVWSDSVYKIYERDPELGPPHINEYKSLYKGKYYEVFMSSIKNAVEKGKPYEHILKLELPGKPYKWLRAICKPEPKANGSGYLLRGTIQDITDIKNNEERLSELNKELSDSNKMKDKLFSIIGHDLKNPFQAMIGTSEAIVKVLKKNDLATVERFANYIKNSALNAHQILDNLLIWSRAQRGKIPFSPESFALSEVVDSVFATVAPAAERKGTNLEAGFSNDLTIKADKYMLYTILYNLISNGIKFTHKGEFVKVTAKKTESGYLFSVIDDGVGITRQNILRLFQIDDTMTSEGTDKEKGTGLGLIICKEFVERHNGKIWVESVVGEGSSFYFTIND